MISRASRRPVRGVSGPVPSRSGAPEGVAAAGFSSAADAPSRPPSRPKSPALIGVARDFAAGDPDGFVPTPADCTEAFLRGGELGPGDLGGEIWEPCCGDGAMARPLAAAGHRVVATDLVDRGFGASRIDFLLERRALADTIVTNPPWHLSTEFILHAAALGVAKTVYLLPLDRLAGLERAELYDRLPPARIWVVPWRVHFRRTGFTGKTNPAISVGWFVWERGFAGAPAVKWLRRDP